VRLPRVPRKSCWPHLVSDLVRGDRQHLSAGDTLAGYPGEMDARTRSGRDELALHGLSIVVLALAVAGLLPNIVGIALASVASGAAAVQALEHRRADARRRRSADALLASIPGLRVPERLRWRAAELTSPEHRLRLARQLRRFSWLAEQPLLLTSIPVYPSTLRPNKDQLRSVASIVGAIDLPVSAQGMVLLDRLLGDGVGSPLYGPAKADELARALQRVRGAMVPVEAAQTGSTSRKA
jgi:hypothetical protein